MSGDGINEIFNEALNAFVDNYLKENKPEDNQKDNIVINNSEKKDKNKKCCY